MTLAVLSGKSYFDNLEILNQLFKTVAENQLVADRMGGVALRLISRDNSPYDLLIIAKLLVESYRRSAEKSHTPILDTGFIVCSFT